MPWSHQLPEFVAAHPGYNANLMEVARSVSQLYGDAWTFIDVGANIGDSAAQVASAAHCSIVCIEGDPYWIPYLQANAPADAVIIEGLLLTDVTSARPVPLRDGSSTRFVPGAGHASVVSADDIVELVRALPPVALIKVDTDGFDATLLPPLLAAFDNTQPAVFFEYDPEQAAQVGNPHPRSIWTELANRGYDTVIVWNNYGERIGRYSPSAAQTAAEVLDLPRVQRNCEYWDVLAYGSRFAGLAESLSVGRDG